MESNSLQLMMGNLQKIIQRSFALYKLYFSTFFAIGIVFGCANVLTVVLMSALSIKSIVVFIVFNLLFTSVATIMAIDAASCSFLGKPMDFKKIFQGVGKKYFSFVLVSAVIIILSSVGAMFFVIPGLLCLTYFIFADVLLVCEDIDFREALPKSIELVKPVFWMVLLFNVVLYSTLLVLVLAIQSLFASMPLLDKIFNVLFMVMVPPFFNILKVVFYYGCKADVEPSLSNPTES